MFQVGPPALLGSVKHPFSNMNTPESTSCTPGPVSASCSSLGKHTLQTPACLLPMRPHKVSLRNQEGILPDFLMCPPITGDIKCQQHSNPLLFPIPQLSFTSHAFVLDLHSRGHSMAFHGYSGQSTQQEEAGTEPVEKAPGQAGDS